jgi:hypothetical protein
MFDASWTCWKLKQRRRAEGFLWWPSCTSLVLMVREPCVASYYMLVACLQFVNNDP